MKGKGNYIHYDGIRNQLAIIGNSSQITLKYSE